MCYVLVNNMYIIEIITLFSIQRRKNTIFSFFHAEELPAGSLVEAPVRGKKTKGIVISSQNIKYLKIRLKKEANFELKPIGKVLDTNPALNKERLDSALSFPTAEIKEIKKSRSGGNRGENTKQILDGYLEKLAERKTASKAKSYMQETAEKYLQYIDWGNETFEEDMRLFWISASNYYKSHTHSHFVKILEWIRKKDSLSPKQVAKLFNK